jgi:hypothetical protein
MSVVSGMRPAASFCLIMLRCCARSLGGDISFLFLRLKSDSVVGLRGGVIFPALIKALISSAFNPEDIFATLQLVAAQHIIIRLCIVHYVNVTDELDPLVCSADLKQDHWFGAGCVNEARVCSVEYFTGFEDYFHVS